VFNGFSGFSKGEFTFFGFDYFSNFLVFSLFLVGSLQIWCWSFSTSPTLFQMKYSNQQLHSIKHNTEPKMAKAT